MPPTIRSIRSGEDEDFLPGQNPFQPGTSSFGDALSGAQGQIDSLGRIVGHYPGVRQEGNQAVDDRSWWERNSGWLIPALMIGGTAGAGLALGGAGAAGAAGAGGASNAASSIPLGVGPTTFGSGSAAGTAAAGLPASLLAENAAMGSGAAGGLFRNAATEAARGGLSDWLNPRNLAALAAAGGSAINGFRAPAGQDRLEDLYNMALQRTKASEPLFNQLNTMVTSQMPAYTRGQQ